MALKSLLAFFLLPLFVSGGCTATPTNAKIFDDLWIALEKKGSSVLPQVRMVLEDSLRHRDRFNHETRKTAFEVLRATSMKDLLPLVRQVAAMDYRILAESGGDLSDVVAIQEALITLREWQDPSAIELSIQRLASDSWLQTTAVNNLRFLKYWQATPEIQKLLDQAPRDLDNLVVTQKLVQYLLSSPDTYSGACESLAELHASFPFCFESDKDRWRCGTLREDTQALESRLGCADVKNLQSSIALTAEGVPLLEPAAHKEIFLCPTEPAVCSWSLNTGWEVLWQAPHDVDRERLSLWGGEGDFRVLLQKSPYGGSLLIFSRSGQIIAAIDQGVPLGGSPTLGEEEDGSFVLCTGRRLDQVACSTWLNGESLSKRQRIPPAYPTGCLFPRSLKETRYCVEDTNPFRDPSLPLRVMIRELPREGSARAHILSLPAGFLADFMPLKEGRALFAYEDGRVFEVSSWNQVLGPIASGALRLQRLRERVYIVSGPSLAEQGAILQVGAHELKTLWVGQGVPREMTAFSEAALLLRIEDPENGRSRILLLEQTAEGMQPRILDPRAAPPAGSGEHLRPVK